MEVGSRCCHSASIIIKEFKMSDTYYKKPNGEVFRYEAGRMKKDSCEAKYTLCDSKGKEIKAEKATKKKGSK